MSIRRSTTPTQRRPEEPRSPEVQRVPPKRRRPLKTEQQEARAMAQRQANEEAVKAGQQMPYPNPWDAVDPTKVPRDATFEEIVQSCREFTKLCPPRPRKQHIL